MENQSRCCRISNRHCFLLVERQIRSAPSARRNRTSAAPRPRGSASRGCRRCRQPESCSSTGGYAVLLGKSDRLTETLEDAFPVFCCPGAGRPAFHNLKCEEPEKRYAGELQIESKIFCDLLDRANSVELRRELCLGDCEPQVLYSFKSIAGVGRNGSRIVISAVAELRELDKAQRRQRPLIDIELARKRGREVGKRSLLKGKADTRCTPKLREKFLPVILRKLHCRFLRNQIFLRQSDEHRAS